MLLYHGTSALAPGLLRSHLLLGLLLRVRLFVQEDLDGRHFGENVVKASFITKEAFDGFADGVL